MTSSHATLAPQPTPTWIAARWMLRIIGGVGIWFLGIALVVQTAVYLILRAAGVQMEGSLWNGFANNGPGWFLFSMGIMLTNSILAPHVGQGMTRRSFSHGQSLALTISAAALAGWVLVLLAYEAVFYGSVGWTQIFNQGHLVDADAAFPLQFLNYLVLFTFYGYMGSLVGVVYYRAGGLWGTAALPLTTIVPLGLIYLLLFTSGSTTLSVAVWFGPDGLPSIGRLAIAVTLIAALALARHLLLRGVPIRGKQA